MVHNANGLKSIRQIVAEVASETVENMPDVTQKKSCKNSLTGLAREAYVAAVKKRVYTVAEVVNMLRGMQNGRTDAQFAEVLGITPAYLCDLYKGRRFPGEKILRHFDLVRRDTEPTYERTA